MIDRGPANSGRRIEPSSIYGREMEAVRQELESRRAAFAERKQWCGCVKKYPDRTYCGYRQCTACGRLMKAQRSIGL